MSVPVIQPALTLPALCVGRSYSYVIAATNNPTSFGLSSVSSELTATISGNVVTFSTQSILLPASLGGSDTPTTYSFEITATNADGTSAAQTVSVQFSLFAAGGCMLWNGTHHENGETFSGYFGSATSDSASFAINLTPTSAYYSPSSGGFVPSGNLFVLAGTDSANHLGYEAWQYNWLEYDGAYFGINWIGGTPPTGSTGFGLDGGLLNVGSIIAYANNGVYDITTPTTLSGTQGGAITPYSIAVSGGGGTASGLPAGLTVNSSQQIVGTPTVAGTFFVTLSDSQSYQRYLTVTIAPEPLPVVTPISDQTLPLYIAATMSLAASNNPISWSATGLPTGVSINAATGVISGTPTVAGSYAITVTATNYGGTSTAVSFNIFVVAIPPTVTLPGPIVGGFYSLVVLKGAEGSVQCSASPAATSWAATGLPAGFSINGTGLISGSSDTESVNPVSITATNIDGTSVPAMLILTIAGKPIVSLPPGLLTNIGYAITYPVGSPVAIQCTATGSPTSWTADGLPPGITIDNTGLISGVATTIATSSVTITATNSIGTSAPATALAINVVAAPPNYVPWVNNDPTLIDLQWDIRTGQITSYCSGTAGITIKMGDDLKAAVIIKDSILNTLIAQLQELELAICPDADFESYFVEINGVTTVGTACGTYFALNTPLDRESCEYLQQVFDDLDNTQGPNTIAKTVTAMCELRAVLPDGTQRRSRLFPLVIEQNATT
jgi:hypothetical protein